MNDEDEGPGFERLPFIGDGASGIHILDGEPKHLFDVAEHIADAIKVVPLERCSMAEDGGGYEGVLAAHARLMMERDLRGLRLPSE